MTKKIIKCKSIYRKPTKISTELLLTLHNDQKPLISKRAPVRSCEGSICASETAYSSLHAMNRGRPCRLNSLPGTLLNLISQE